MEKRTKVNYKGTIVSMVGYGIIHNKIANVLHCDTYYTLYFFLDLQKKSLTGPPL